MNYAWIWRLGALILLLAAAAPQAETAGLRKIEDIIIYRDPTFYAAFPSIVTRPDGELIVAFRRAPDRRIYGESRNTHVDANSYLVQVRSRDGGKSWSSPELIFAHPNGGSQDPCMVQLRDGSIVCSSYGWAWVADTVKDQFTNSMRQNNFIFMGGYLLRSDDGGRSWEGPILPPALPVNVSSTVFGTPLPAYNRGAMTQGQDGRLYWAVATHASLTPRRTENHLLISADGGRTWDYSCPLAVADDISFNETSLYETPAGDLVAFIRTANFDDHTVVARSSDGGRSFQPWVDTGWRGHPHYALRLPDQRVLLVYGYRHEPYGIRARVLNPECTDVAEAEEIILRADGSGRDLGYPWATLTADGRILVVYYFHDAEGTSHIAGTLLELE